MKTKYLDDKLRIIVRGDEYDLRDCAKIILAVTNGGINGHRNVNMLELLLSGELLTVGHYKRERVKVCDNKIIYGFIFDGSSKEAEDAARNHYNVIKENIQKITGENCYRIKRING